MGATSLERTALEQLAAARLRGAKPDELLELAEAAIDQATAASDTLTLESVAAELDSAALAHPPFDQGDGLRFQLAAGRARAIASHPPATAAPEDAPVPTAAKAAFWVTVAIAALTLFYFGTIAGQDSAASWDIAFLLLFLVPLGSLFVAVTGVVGWVQSDRAGSRKGVLMSAAPCAVVLLLIVVRISLSLV
jgi:hypothetical protein